MNERRTATHAFEGAYGMITEIGECLRTEVGKLMVFPVPPDVFRGIELWGVGRQGLYADRPVLTRHKLLNQAAAVGLGTIPNHQQLILDVTFKMAEKLHHLGTTNTARMQLKVKVPPGDAGHRRKLLPIKRILQYRSLPFGRPGPTTVRSLTQPAFVDEHYRAPLTLGFFLSFGQLRFCHRSMADSSRCNARPVGRWQLQPSFPNSQPTCPGWYSTPKSCSISLATRCRVHKLVSYPKAWGPCLSFISSFFRSVSFKRGLRPARPAFLSPSRPRFSNLLCPAIDRLAVYAYLSGHFRFAQSFFQQPESFKPPLL